MTEHYYWWWNGVKRLSRAEIRKMKENMQKTPLVQEKSNKYHRLEEEKAEKLLTTIVNEELLQEDVTQHLDYLSRVASLPENTVFVATNKTAKELLRLSQISKSNTGLKLEQIAKPFHIRIEGPVDAGERVATMQDLKVLTKKY